MYYERSLPAFKYLLIATALVLGASAAAADTLICHDVLIEESVHIVGETKAPTDPKIDQAIADMKTKLLRPASKSQTIILLSAAQRYDDVTTLLTRLHVHAYPFSYIAEGVVPKIRSWTKTGDKDTEDEINQWLTRYGSYQTDRQVLVEHAFFVRNEATLLQELLKRPARDFPLEISIPKHINKGLFEEKTLFTSRADVAAELRALKTSASSMFGVSYGNGRFLKGRDIEQAHLRVRLEIVLRELKNNPLAGKNSGSRVRLIEGIRHLLEEGPSDPPPAARYVEARRALTDEIGYFAGRRELTDSAKAVVEDTLEQDDVYQLGLDRERLGVISRFARNLVVHTPNIVMGAVALIYAPLIKDDVKSLIFKDAVMHEIASLPQAQYETKSLEFLKTVYHVQIVDGSPVLTDSAQKALRLLQKDRDEHLEDLHKENITQGVFDLALNTHGAPPKIGAEDFKSLMELSPDNFPDAAHKLIAARASGADARMLFTQLSKSYETVHQSDGDEDRRSSVGDKIFDSYTDLILNQDAKDGGE